MSTVNISRATATLAKPAFLKSAVLIVVGALLAQMLTDYLRQNVYDLPVKGADSIYPLVAAFLALAVLPSQYGKPIALGSTATSVRVAANQLGIV